MKRLSSSPWDRLVLPSWSCAACKPSRIRPISSSTQSQPSSHQQSSPSRRPFSTTSPRTVTSSIPPHKSAKLAALHARLALPSSFPITTLARSLIDPSTEPDLHKNNDPLCNIGNTLAGYFVTEHLLCTYPRLPLSILQTSLQAFAGPKVLATLGREWGVEQAYEPTPDVDPGLLQFRRLEPGQEWKPQSGGIAGSDKRRFLHQPPKAVTDQLAIGTHAFEEQREKLEQQQKQKSRKKKSRNDNEDISHLDVTAEVAKAANQDSNYIHPQTNGPAIPFEFAMANFVRSTIAGVYLHAGGLPAAKSFITSHLLSRKLEMGKLFKFSQPTRILSRLCQREGFEPPVARLLAETGRNSRHPVFVVGVFSGAEKLGEGQGSSLDEARTKAAISALKGWYLYRPVAAGVDLPSKTLGRPLGMAFKPVIIDVGEVIC